MTAVTVTPVGDIADRLAETLVSARSGPFLGTPCGVLATLYRKIDQSCGVHTVAREDSAVGFAAGAALAGRQPVVLMQNSGFGQSVNAFASLVVPYALDVLTVISMRGVAPDNTEENAAMGVLTVSVLAELGADVRHLHHGADVDQSVADWLRADPVRSRPRFLLIAPGLFGWCP